MVQLRCAACGFVSDVDVRDKLIAFILKNPPEPKKGSKDNKAMQKAKNKRLKEGEATNEKQKKLKKVMKMNGSSNSNDGHAKVNYNKKKASGPDEDQSSPTISQVDEKEEIDNDNDDNVPWQTNTSLEATRQRIEEQLR
ncbi:Eukaryotic translation initiation factor 5 [Camellia lanceoleosa]|uniref:Eukaryotic translation initiation factor 5 n=1 Tax=Camellia lanceoleosa TaxID=1840588 RepID=A0ACC0GC50_9ERIC|nr:Eukaryotic translation initiation factor 5 [Camellia lanceoleosa]